jgi:hypothetical protein
VQRVVEDFRAEQTNALKELQSSIDRLVARLGG